MQLWRISGITMLHLLLFCLRTRKHLEERQLEEWRKKKNFMDASSLGVTSNWRHKHTSWRKRKIISHAYELKEEKIMPRGQVKKVRSGRAKKIQGQRHAMVWPPETSMHWGGVLKYAMNTWNILEDYGNHKKLTLQCIRIRSWQCKKVLEEWRASMSNFSRENIFV